MLSVESCERRARDLVLVVEDDPVLVPLFVRTLTALRLPHLLVRNARQALRLVERHRERLRLVVVGPGDEVGGGELLRTLRTLRAVPAVVIGDDEGDDADADGVLARPFTAAQLREAITAVT